jgi:RNase P subunit RPR2
MEKQTEVKAYNVHQYCDKCGEELTFTGEVLLTNPEKYVHKCNKCGNTEWFPKSYPCIEYKEVQRNPITNIVLTDSFKESLNRVSKHNNEIKKHKCSELTFRLNPIEAQEYHDFCNKHKSCEFSSTIGGKISIIFTPTGLGDIVVVKCNKCGEEKDITDVSNW